MTIRLLNLSSVILFKTYRLTFFMILQRIAWIIVLEIKIKALLVSKWAIFNRIMRCRLNLVFWFVQLQLLMTHIRNILVLPRVICDLKVFNEVLNLWTRVAETSMFVLVVPKSPLQGLVLLAAKHLQNLHLPINWLVFHALEIVLDHGDQNLHIPLFILVLSAI